MKITLEEKIFGSHVIFWLIVLVFAFFSGTVKADWYMTAGYGQSEYHFRNGDGFWRQEETPGKDDTKPNMWGLGVGKQLTPWLAVEGAYYDLGMYTNFLKFCSDYYYENTRCRINGDKWVGYGHGVGEAHALAVSLLPQYHFGSDWSVFLRGGVTYYWTKYYVSNVTDGDPISAPLNIYGNPTMVRGQGYITGAGVGYKDVRVEYLYFPDISGSDTAHDRVTALTVSALWKF